jgi:hypothetical protein
MFGQTLSKKTKHILRSKAFSFFSKTVTFMRECKEVWYSQTGHRGQNNTAHAVGMLDN